MTSRVEAVGLIACGAAKTAAAAPAKDLYTGGYFLQARTYIEQRCERWGILSAKYGLLLPDQVVEPYNVKLAGLTSAERRRWAMSTRSQIILQWPEDAATGAFVIIAGKEYRAALEGLRSWCPWDDLPKGRRTIGHQKHWLKEAVQ